MKIAVVVDAACDLPRAYVEHYGIEVLPIQINVGEETFLDRRDPDETKSFYLNHLHNNATAMDVQALGIDDTGKHFLNHLVTQFDRVLVLTISAQRAPIFESATKASFAIVKDQRHLRNKAGLPGSFAVRVIDCKNMLTGQAVLAHEAVRLINEEDLAFERLRPNMEQMSRSVQSFLVPRTLKFLYRRQRGQRNLGLLGFAAAKTLDLKPVIAMRNGEVQVVKKAVGYRSALGHVFDSARTAIDTGLQKPLIAMSFAGEPREMLQRDDYQEFADYAQSRGTEILLAVMSASAGASAGPGAFSLAYAV